MSPSLRVQVGKLARRSISRTLRQPILVLPNVVLPLFLLAVLTSGNKQVTQIPGFPTKSYVTFVLGASLVQGAAAAMTIAGNALGSDIETGFLSRLALTPVRGSALIGAQLAGVTVLGVAQGVLYLLVGLAFGAHVKAGVGGAFVVIAIVLLMVLAFGAIGLFAAVRMGSAQQTQALLPLALGLLFMSSMFMPRNLIKAHWFRDIATYNPLSYLVEAPRSLFVDGWDGEALALGCAVAAAILVAALAAAGTSMKTRLLRT